MTLVSHDNPAIMGIPAEGSFNDISSLEAIPEPVILLICFPEVQPLVIRLSMSSSGRGGNEDFGGEARQSGVIICSTEFRVYDT